MFNFASFTALAPSAMMCMRGSTEGGGAPESDDATLIMAVVAGMCSCQQENAPSQQMTTWNK